MTEYCYLLNVVLFSRLIFTFRDKSISPKHAVAIILLQILGISIFEVKIILAILALVLVGTNWLTYFLEHKFDKLNFIRLASFFAFVVMLSIFFAPGIGMKFNSSLIANLKTLTDYSLILNFLEKLDWAVLNPLLLGALLVTNETNILIRTVFQIFRLAPERAREPDQQIITIVDNREYNAGRIIGVLERLLIYYFVLNNQFAAIGLIIAAKSFARFKDLEKREFAEYVLIGTLLSTLLAIFIAKLVQLM